MDLIQEMAKEGTLITVSNCHRNRKGHTITDMSADKGKNAAAYRLSTDDE
jgi:hypothetical protein